MGTKVKPVKKVEERGAGKKGKGIMGRIRAGMDHMWKKERTLLKMIFIWVQLGAVWCLGGGE
jgi:hypothetical protein